METDDREPGSGTPASRQGDRHHVRGVDRDLYRGSDHPRHGGRSVGRDLLAPRDPYRDGDRGDRGRRRPCDPAPRPASHDRSLTKEPPPKRRGAGCRRGRLGGARGRAPRDRRPGRRSTPDRLVRNGVRRSGRHAGHAVVERLRAGAGSGIVALGGWFAEQEWRGARLDRLLDGAVGESIVVRSVTGYNRRFPRSGATGLLLATHVGDAPLSTGHGAPAPLVVPGRRGFWWVKWVTGIDVSDEPSWWQSPFPLT
ncbi:MAG: hypothetical protein E6G37_07420 [Actinobacteria bacterium]|nr:MAG: hypothetical protein E6G37_07420 [Actinomycetota bacterium]